MASEPLLAAYGMPVVEHGHSVRSNFLSNYWTLTKPEILLLSDDSAHCPDSLVSDSGRMTASSFCQLTSAPGNPSDCSSVL
jgi:hypothetical protein